MAINKHKYKLQLVRKARRRYKMKSLVASSREEKFILYFLKSNKNIHLNLVGKEGKSLISVNTIKYRRENPNLPRRELVKKPLNLFIEKLLVLLPNLKPTQMVYDISYYQYEGNVKVCIDAVKQAILNNVKQ